MLKLLEHKLQIVKQTINQYSLRTLQVTMSAVKDPSCWVQKKHQLLENKRPEQKKALLPWKIVAEAMIAIAIWRFLKTFGLINPNVRQNITVNTIDSIKHSWSEDCLNIIQQLPPYTDLVLQKFATIRCLSPIYD